MTDLPVKIDERSTFADFALWLQQELLFPAVVSPGTILSTLKCWDSFTAFRFVVQMEAMGASWFPIELIESLETVGDLHHFATTKLGHQQQ